MKSVILKKLLVLGLICGSIASMSSTLTYADAKKEFSLSAMTGFGADGSREEQEQDFEQVRGAFESNPFVTAVLQHIEAKTALGNELIERISPLI